MASLDFPSSPSVNDIYTANGRSFQWDGVSWNNLTGTGFTGSQGYTGYTGSFGFTGSRGYTGSIGYTGSRGYTGSAGVVGFAGSKGYTGSVGSSATAYVLKTSTYTASNLDAIIADTSGGSWTLTLPATPSQGYQLLIADGAAWGTNNLTVARNGSTIEGLAEDLILDISGVYVQFIYSGSTWQIFAQVGAAGGSAVTLNGTETLTNKTIEAGIFTNGYTEEVYAVSGTTPALSPTNGSIQTWTLSGNSTPTAGTWAAGQSLTLMIDDGTDYTITWTSLSVTWKTDGGSAPTLNTTGYTAIALWKVGSTIYGARVGDA